MPPRVPSLYETVYKGPGLEAPGKGHGEKIKKGETAEKPGKDKTLGSPEGQG
jgi:hypothetical protein